ncbi:MAG: ribonuclease H-like domain-containing protein [Nanoarchaeota archaeon]|nr:ribonuclease H-like domain-containing protein [Nanoarchaeota archaeon]MBU1596943.1 ribonuclease H-like domain-containing protein [Nanoarchaeota archaeon]MBU2442340.1 ribonuclease H-like domain-containing protein [Nanoarchaeota archaeon]
MALSHWKELYEQHKHEALCIDIEATYWDGPISVIGVYKPQDGEIDYTAFVKGKNLTTENLKQAFAKCKLLITFNGIKYDVPEIRKQFPGVIPENIPVVDLYLIARRINFDGGLKTLERTFNIFRKDEVDNKRKISTKMWKKYEEKGNEAALNTLIEYNRQDAINLYPLAEKIMGMID